MFTLFLCVSTLILQTFDYARKMLNLFNGLIWTNYNCCVNFKVMIINRSWVWRLRDVCCQFLISFDLLTVTASYNMQFYWHSFLSISVPIPTTHKCILWSKKNQSERVFENHEEESKVNVKLMLSELSNSNLRHGYDNESDLSACLGLSWFVKTAHYWYDLRTKASVTNSKNEN